jgi:HPt (histidine-containing phosphotransfer) domain-containing protein
VDVKTLQAQVGNEPEVTREFFREFQHSATGIAADLRAAVQAGKLDVIKKVAHKLKSPARSVGAFFLSEICARIEETCKSGQGDGLPLLLDQFEIELASVNRFMDSW